MAQPVIQRLMRQKLKELARKFPVVTVTGPRQSGKSTLAKMAFPDYRYVSLEDPTCANSPKAIHGAFLRPIIIA